MVVNASQYLQKLHECLVTVKDTPTVTKHYEFIQSQIVGSTVAKTASCWLDLPLLDTAKKYHTVLATDEYFTYSSLTSQQKLIETVIACTQQRLIVTVRDFKNSNRYDLTNNFAVNQAATSLIVSENIRSAADDRQGWFHDTFLIHHDHAGETTVQHIGTVSRRAVYFKQLAKFCFDAGCKTFRVIPNVLFKPLFKNHIEHVIVVDW